MFLLPDGMKRSHDVIWGLMMVTIVIGTANALVHENGVSALLWFFGGLFVAAGGHTALEMWREEQFKEKFRN